MANVNPLSKTWLGKDLQLLEELGYPRPGRRLLLLSALSFIGGLSQAVVLALVAAFAVNVVRSHDGITELGIHISVLGGVFIAIGLAAVFATANVLAAKVGSALSGGVLRRVRATVMSSFFESDWSVQSGDYVGHIQQTLFYECEQVGNLIGSIGRMLTLAASVSALMLVALIVGPLLAIGVVAAGLTLSFLLRPLQKRIRTASKSLKGENALIGQRVNEFTRLAREFRIFGVEKSAVERLKEQNDRSGRIFERSQFLLQVSPLSYQLAGVIFLILGLCFIKVLGSASLAPAAAVFVIIMRTIPLATNMQSFAASAHSQSALLESVASEVRRFDAAARSVTTGVEPTSFNVVVDDVSFSYPGRGTVLDHVSFEVPDNQSLGILGRSGSGKTTLSQLILGILQPEDGRIVIGGAAPEEVVEGAGRSTVAVVTQDAGLIAGTVASNIEFFRQLPRSVVVDAARRARIDADIELMVGTYEAVVGDAGSNLSGGQRQRLALARALAGSPRLLILDEPTSAVDAQSELLIRQSIQELESTTTIIVTHRLAAVAEVDWLLILEAGRVAAFGPRASVMTSPAYARIAMLVEDEE